MITFILIALVIGVFVFLMFTNVEKYRKYDAWIQSSLFRQHLGFLVVGLVVAFVQPFSVERVDAGHVGLKVHLTGDNRGVGKFEYKTGWVVYNTWVERLYEFPTYQQTIEYPQQQIIMKGGFPTTIHPKFNYSLKAGSVGHMFSNLRLGVKEIEQGWLQTAIVGAVNDVANRWTVDDVFNHREQFEAEIVAETNKRVQKWFTISQLRTNIVPPQSLQDAIVKKTKAIQDVQVAENQKLVAIAEGERKIATARADSAALVIAAAGEAEAIKRKQATLTSEYIEYEKVQKWDGALPTYSGGGGGLFLNLNKQ